MFTKATVVALMAINILLAQALPVLDRKYERLDEMLDQLKKGPITHTSSSQTTSTTTQTVSSNQNVPSILNLRELLKDPNFVSQLYTFLLKYLGSSNSQSSSSQASQLLSSSQLLGSSQTASSGQAVGSNQSPDFRGFFSSPSFLNFLISFITQSHNEIAQNEVSAPVVVATTNQGDAAHVSHVSASHSTSSSTSNQAVTNNESQTSNSHVSTQINGHSRPPVIIVPIITAQNGAVSTNNQAASAVTVNHVSNQNQATSQNQLVSNQNQENVNNQASSVVVTTNQNQVVSNQNQATGNNEESYVASVSNQNNVVTNQNQVDENDQASSVVSVSIQNQESSQNQVVSNQQQENIDNQDSFVVSTNNQNQANGNNAVTVSQTSASELSESQVSATSNEADAGAVVVPVIVVPSFEDRFGDTNENSQPETSATAQVVTTSDAQSSEANNAQETFSSTSDQTSQLSNIQDLSGTSLSQEDILRKLEQWVKAMSSQSAESVQVSQSGQTSHSGQTSQSSQTSQSGQFNQGFQIPAVQVPIVPTTSQIVIGLDNVMGGHASSVLKGAHKQVYDAAEERRMAQNAKYEFANQVRDEIEGNFQERAEVRDGTKVYGKYGYDDGSQSRTVYYEADENGYRVTKTIVSESHMHKNPEGDVNVQSINNGRKVNYHITRKDISPVKPKRHNRDLIMVQ